MARAVAEAARAGHTLVTEPGMLLVAPADGAVATNREPRNFQVVAAIRVCKHIVHLYENRQEKEAEAHIRTSPHSFKLLPI